MIFTKRVTTVFFILPSIIIFECINKSNGINDTHTHDDDIDHGGNGMKDMDDMDGHKHKHDMNDMGHMAMSFHAGVKVTILFKEWAVSSVGGIIGSVIGIFLLAIIYEGLKFFREHLFKLHLSSIQFSTVAVTEQNGGTITEVHDITKHKMLSWSHSIQTVLHVIQMIISYFLMLIFMTYNVWLCLAVILGSGVGYFLFGWRKATVVDVTEHCH